MPYLAQVGRTSASMPRVRIEYGGCSQMYRWRFCSRAAHCATTIADGGNVEEPM
jgi:hypothetical protein